MAGKGKRRARIIITLAAYALAGLVTTLGIAWSGALLDAEVTMAVWIVPPAAATAEVPTGARVMVHRWSSWRGIRYTREVLYLPSRDASPPHPPKDPAAIAAELRTLPTESEQWGAWPINDAVATSHVGADNRGFPFLCLWSCTNRRQEIPAPGTPWNFSFDLARVMGKPADPELRLPLTPLWPGLIADTIIWGFAWFALLFVPVHLRPWIRASRTRRGLCIACGYDLTGARGRCPECGVETAPAQPKPAASA